MTCQPSGLSVDAFILLPSAFFLLLSSLILLPFAFFLLPFAFCLLPLFHTSSFFLCLSAS
jgi:hypothetical protein